MPNVPFLLVGQPLVLGLLLGRTLVLFRDLLVLLLGLLVLLLGPHYDSVADLAHDLALLARFEDSKTDSRPDSHVQRSHGQGVLPEHPLETAPGSPDLRNPCKATLPRKRAGLLRAEPRTLSTISSTSVSRR